LLETFDPPGVTAGAAFSTVTGYGSSTTGTGTNTATATFASDQIRAGSGRTLNGKLVFVTGSGGGGATRTARMTRTFTAMDMSEYTHITFWVRGSVAGTSWYTVVVGSSESTYTLAANTWTEITMALPANRSAITTIAFGVTGNSRNGSMWVDNVQLITQ